MRGASPPSPAVPFAVVEIKRRATGSEEHPSHKVYPRHLPPPVTQVRSSTSDRRVTCAPTSTRFCFIIFCCVAAGAAAAVGSGLGCIQGVVPPAARRVQSVWLRGRAPGPAQLPSTCQVGGCQCGVERLTGETCCFR